MGMDVCTNSKPWNESNQDISGPGVRISFYLQAFILVLLVNRSWEDAPIALWTLIATSAGLMIAAAVQHENLTLLQALIVSNLVWLANFATFVALASYSRRKAGRSDVRKNKLDFGVKPAATALTIISMGLTFYIWSSPSTFDECEGDSDKVRYGIFFGWAAIATGPGRIVALVFTGLLTLGYVYLSVEEFQSYLKSRRKAAAKRRARPTSSQSTNAPTVGPANFNVQPPLENQELPATNQAVPPPTSPSVRPCNQPSSTFSAARLPDRGQSSEHPASRRPSATDPVRQDTLGTVSLGSGRSAVARRPDRRNGPSRLDPMLVGILIFQAVVFSYFIVSTELTLNIFNGHNTANGFEFGQILALVLVIPSLLSLIDALEKHGFNRLERPRNRRKNKRKARPRVRQSNIHNSIQMV